MGEYVYTKGGERLYSVNQASEEFDVSVSAICIAAKDGRLKTYATVAGSRFFTRRNLVKYDRWRRRVVGGKLITTRQAKEGEVSTMQKMHELRSRQFQEGIKEDILHPRQKEFLEYLARGESPNVSMQPRNGTTFADKLTSSLFTLFGGKR